MSDTRSMRHTVARTLLVVYSSVASALGLALAPPIIGDISLENNQNAVLGYPQGGAVSSHVLISRKQYLINWSESWRAPRWVSWTLNKRTLGEVNRTNVFRKDQELSGYLSDSGALSVSPEEFKGSCIDRGHQVASGDRTANLLDNQATFLMSNIAPQSAFLNRRTWVSFERFLRNAVLEQGKEIYIVSGVAGRSHGKIGINEDIAVHSKNYKVAVIKPATSREVPISEMRLLIVEMNNTTSTGTNPVIDRVQACDDSEHMARLDVTNRKAYWRRSVSTLARIEAATNLDFSYLNEIPEMTDEEIDAMIGDQSSRGFSFTSAIHPLSSIVNSNPFD